MTTPSEQFRQIVADEWETRMQEDPLFATSTGDHRFNDRLPGVTEADFERRLQGLRGLQRRLEALDHRALPLEDRLDFDIFTRLLENDLGQLRFRAYRMPISKAGGFHTYFPDLGLQVPLETAGDYQNYIARLNAFLRYTEEYIDVMRTGLREGQVPPRVTLEGVRDSLHAQLVEDPIASQFYQPFVRLPAVLSAAEAARLRAAGKDAIRVSILPAYVTLLRFVDGEYLPQARESLAAADLPDGQAYYRHCIRSYTSLEMSPQEIHQTGLDEVARIRSEMEAALRESGFDGDRAAFVAFLRSDPRFYVDDPEALLASTALILKRMDGELPRLFKTLPRLPYGIRPIPDFAAPGSTTAYYMPGTGDGTRAGTYYVNTYDLKARPLYEQEALSLHEAVPGHHLQIALQQELDLPNFRRFGGFTSFVEGWALYAERLGLEVGFYQDPYRNFGRLSYEMWRACRLVVDTGLHALGWTRQQAVAFMVENTSLTSRNIANEVDRYIAWPGQALAYKIGEITIRRLRAEAEKELGARFDLRTFHDVLLTGGALPLDVLEARVKVWVDGQSA
ncbi:MAG: DUF885 domain-containing protein [Anaerolineales bacterium]|nr:DUF885 domain-containing protein [Anaerolineales bacterium]